MYAPPRLPMPAYTSFPCEPQQTLAYGTSPSNRVVAAPTNLVALSPSHAASPHVLSARRPSGYGAPAAAPPSAPRAAAAAAAGAAAIHSARGAAPAALAPAGLQPHVARAGNGSGAAAMIAAGASSFRSAISADGGAGMQPRPGVERRLAPVPPARPVAAVSAAVESNTSGAFLPDGSGREASPTTVVFLDVDGVLHPEGQQVIFKEQCCRQLEKIVRATDAAVVVSSTWRKTADKLAKLGKILEALNLAPVHSITPDFGGIQHRAAEICCWLDANPGIQRWVALDDMNLPFLSQSAGAPSDPAHGARLTGHFVQTNTNVGLTSENAAAAISLLLAGSGNGSIGACADRATLGAA